MLQQKADNREESEKWANYHAKKNKVDGASNPRSRTQSPQGGTMRRSLPNDAAERGRRALSTTSSIKPRGTPTGTGTSRQAPKSRLPRRSNQGVQFEASLPPEMDSSMFFPLGTKIKHAVHGEGKVVKPTAGQDAQNVHVDFESGMKIDFPLGSPGLNIQY